MKLLLALLLWSQGVYSSSSAAATATSSAAEVKSTAAQGAAQRGVHGSIPERAAVVGATIGMPAEISSEIAEFAGEYPEMPEDIANMLGGLEYGMIRAVPQEIYKWLEADPRNVNSVYTYNDGRNEMSLLFYVIHVYSRKGAIMIPLFSKILDMNPDVRYQTRITRRATQDALSYICEHIIPQSKNFDEQMDFVRRIIDLNLQQGADPAALESELREALSAKEEDINADEDAASPEDKYTRGIIAAALDYLQYVQKAAAIVEEEMTERLGTRDVARISAGYIAPSQPKKQTPQGTKNNGK